MWPSRLDPRKTLANEYSDAVSSVMLHAVLETSMFSRRADALLSVEDRAALIDMLARYPTAGDVMPGLGGVRKLRFAPKGRGKSGGFRVIYYMLTESQPIIALMIYGKNEQSDLSPAQRKAVAAIAAEMKRGTGI